MDGGELWPWWLWALTALWIATALVWRPAAASLREQAAWTTFTVLLAGLVIFAVQMTPPTNEAATSPWIMRLLLAGWLSASFAAIGLRHARWDHLVTIAALGGAALVFLQLHAPEATVACGFPAVLLLRRMNDEIPAAPASPHRWLTGAAALVMVVVTLGVTRHALLAESDRRHASRHHTAFPTREWRLRQSSLPATASTIKPEWWGLAAIVALAAMTGQPLARTEEPPA